MPTRYLFALTGLVLVVVDCACDAVDPAKPLAPSVATAVRAPAKVTSSSQPRPDVIAIRNSLVRSLRWKSDRNFELVRVTKSPFRIESSLFVLCVPNIRSVPNNPHGDRWIDVYVTDGGRRAMSSGKGTYPEGTVILKQKYTDPAGTKTELFTGMLKREKGYNAQVGDWEFFALNSDATAITASGRIESCIDCHRPYKNTDFVSRRYLDETIKAH